MSRLLHYETDKFFTISGQSVAPTGSDVIYISDFFDSKLLTEIVEIHGSFQFLVTDVESRNYDNSPVPIIFVPGLRMGMLNWVYWFDQNDYNKTQHCFNFAINKKRPDRHCLLKLIEWFDLDSYVYTWSGIGANFDCARLIQDVNAIDAEWNTEQFFSHLLSPVQKISPTWLHAGPDCGAVHGSNRDAGDSIYFMKQSTEIFATSAVALITECSTDYQPNFTFSEKTMMAIASLNFPIWVGNYGQANQAEHMGFDVFADIIDHDYQYKDTVLERCFYAVHDNLQILSDLGLARRARQKCMQRLLQNRSYLLGANFRQWARQQTERLPQSVQNQMQVAYPALYK